MKTKSRRQFLKSAAVSTAGVLAVPFLSGWARAYAVTRSKPTQEKVHRLVRAFAETVEPTGKFYVDYRLPGYTFDKTCCGLIDAHEFAADPIALDVLKRSTDAVLPHLPEKALSRAEQEARPHKTIAYTWDETYTLPENLFLAYQRSSDKRYRDLAVRFIYHEYYDALAENHNALPGKHAYSHVNTLSSAMQAYLMLGNEKYLRAAANGLRMVQEQSYATGGWGPNEAFVEPGKGLLAASLGTTRSSFETPCGAYGQFKITRYLLRVTRDSRYGDNMEQVLYNTVAGAKPILADGTSFYYSDYNSAGAKKVYYKDKWPCCSGTFPQLTADYGISSYYPAKEGIYVNLFLPSRVRWVQGGTHCTLTQQTRYPATNAIQLQLDMARPEMFAIHLRVPAWADTKTRIAVNGKRAEGDPVAGRFFELSRTWKNADRVDFKLACRSVFKRWIRRTHRSWHCCEGRWHSLVSGICPRTFPVRNFSPLLPLLSLQKTGSCKVTLGKTHFVRFGQSVKSPTVSTHR